MAAVKNRLKVIRHQLQIDHQKEFAELLRVTPQKVSLWENQTEQPSLTTLIKLWLKLKVPLPSLNLQDLVDYDPE